MMPSPSSGIRDSLALTAIATLALAMLGAGYSTWRSLQSNFTAGRELDATSLERLTGVTLGLLGALVILWLLFCLVLALLARIAAAHGNRRSSAVLAALLPGFIARLALAGLGGSLVLAGCSANTAPAGTAAVAAATAQAAAVDGVGVGVGPGSSAPAPGLRRPAPVDAPGDGTELLSPGFIPHRLPLPLDRLAGATTRSPDEVVVRSGDSLWSIAARHLPRDAGSDEIAAAWPLWYEANRRLIGPDPNMLEIGWVLRTPSANSPAS